MIECIDCGAGLAPARPLKGRQMPPPLRCDPCVTKGWGAVQRDLQRAASVSRLRETGLPGWAQRLDLDVRLVERAGETPPAFIERVQAAGSLGVPAEARTALELLQAWPTAHACVYLYGEPGSGKTTLAMAALATRVRGGGGGLYLRESALTGATLATQDILYARACAAPLVLLDDLGTTRSPTSRVVDLLEGIIVARIDERRPMLITSNERLGQAMVERLGERLVQRLLGAGPRQEVSGFNWRLRRRVQVRRAR